MTVELIAHVVDNSQADVVVQITLAKIHQTTEGEDSDDQRRQESQYRLVLAREDIVHNMLDQERDRPVRRAKPEHADHAQCEVRPNIGL